MSRHKRTYAANEQSKARHGVRCPVCDPTGYAEKVAKHRGEPVANFNGRVTLADFARHVHIHVDGACVKNRQGNRCA